MTHSQMQHERPLPASMPMRRPRITPHRIPHVQLSGLVAFITYPARSREHAQELAVFVRVPECAGAGGEHYVVDVDGGAGVDVDGTVSGKRCEFEVFFLFSFVVLEIKRGGGCVLRGWETLHF